MSTSMSYLLCGEKAVNSCNILSSLEKDEVICSNGNNTIVSVICSQTKKKKLICFFLSAVSATREREKEKLPGQLERNLHRIFSWFSADVVQGNIYQIDSFRLAITASYARARS